jgi:hypothetical protein
MTSLNRFQLETCKGRRVCWLCDEPIRKGEKFLTVWIQTRYGGVNINFHIDHLNDEMKRKLILESL